MRASLVFTCFYCLSVNVPALSTAGSWVHLRCHHCGRSQAASVWLSSAPEPTPVPANLRLTPLREQGL